MNKLIVALLLAIGVTSNAFAISENKTNTLELRGTTSGGIRLSSPAAAGSNNYVLPAVDGSSGDAIVTDGSQNLSFANSAGWAMYTVTHTALQAGSLGTDIVLFSLAANSVVEKVVIKHSTAFAGTGITAYTVGIGVNGDTKYATFFDVLQAVADGTRQLSSSFDMESLASATDITIRAEALGANLDQSTAGSVDVWVKTSALQEETP